MYIRCCAAKAWGLSHGVVVHNCEARSNLCTSVSDMSCLQGLTMCLPCLSTSLLFLSNSRSCLSLSGALDASSSIPRRRTALLLVEEENMRRGAQLLYIGTRRRQWGRVGGTVGEM